MKKCRCTNINHVFHLGHKCDKKAITNDDMCKDCSTKAADEWVRTQPLLINVFDNITAKDLIIPFKLVKVYIEKKPKFIGLLIIIYVFFAWLTSFVIKDPWVMFFINIIVDALTFYIGFIALTKVREVTQKS